MKKLLGQIKKIDPSYGSLSFFRSYGPGISFSGKIRRIKDRFDLSITDVFGTRSNQNIGISELERTLKKWDARWK